MVYNSFLFAVNCSLFYVISNLQKGFDHWLPVSGWIRVVVMVLTHVCSFAVLLFLKVGSTLYGPGGGYEPNSAESNETPSKETPIRIFEIDYFS